MSARLTPYELAFDVERFERDVFPAIRAEAEERATALVAPDALFMLGSTARVLRELQPGPPPANDSDEPALPPADAVRQYGSLLFHAYRFWSAGRRVFTLTEELVRHLAGIASVGAWDLVTPADAGYVQLPKHLVWARIGEDAAPEAIDGFFWSRADQAAGPASARLDLLVALGLHPGRPGFSVVEATAQLPAPPPGHWGDLDAREAGPDFANILAGGDLRGLLALTSPAEVLKLVSRVFYHIHAHPGAVGPLVAAQRNSEQSTHEMPASTISARTVRLQD